MYKCFTAVLLLGSLSSPLLADESMHGLLKEAATGEHRSQANIARNTFRHPIETLTFFGLEKDMTVIEISPGGLWYAEILAPALKESGNYIAAGYDPAIDGQPEYRYRQTSKMEQRFAAEDMFSEAAIVRFSPPQSVTLGQSGSADMVVTFRNTHGWIRDGVDELVYQAFFEVLKPGGVLGVVQHRGPSTAEGFSGYVTEEQVITVATKAGFVLEARSQINANPRDTKDHPKGVWTLPPVLRLGDVDREKYIAIGESDRMTLRFRKPD